MLLRFDVGVTHLLQACEFSYTTGDNVIIIDVVEVVIYVYFSAFDSIGADIKADTLIFQAIDHGGHFVISIGVFEFWQLRKRIRFQ